MPMFHTVPLMDSYPKFDQMVQLCVAEKDAWLELENTEAMVNNNLLSTKVIKVVIGGTQGSNGAVASFDPNKLPAAAKRASLTSTVSNTERILQFQQAVIKHWKEFKGGASPVVAPVMTPWGGGMRGGQRAMPRQQGYSSAGLVASALAAGFKAISTPAAGVPTGTCTIPDLVRYVATCRPKLTDAGLIDFKKLAPNPRFGTGAGDYGYQTDARIIPMIPSKKPHGGRWAYDKEVTDLPAVFQRKLCYGFRGDGRAPGQIKGAGGFDCNYTRPDRIAKYPKGALNPKPFEDVAEYGALDLEKFLQEYDFRGFISMSKSYRIAKHFATVRNNTPRAQDGWVYACFMEGGWEIPAKGTYKRPSGKDFKVPFSEQEITMPGRLDWEDVVACRHVTRYADFDGPIYLKPSFAVEDPTACREIFELLSGKSQDG